MLAEVLGASGGYIYDFEFGIYDDVPSFNVDLYVQGYYQGNPAHNVKLQHWNYASPGWVNVTANKLTSLLLRANNLMNFFQFIVQILYPVEMSD